MGTWMTSLMRSQQDEGPLGPKERKAEEKMLWGKDKNREREVDGLRLFLP